VETLRDIIKRGLIRKVSLLIAVIGGRILSASSKKAFPPQIQRETSDAQGFSGQAVGDN
jgi:hypothetical protein